MHARAPTKCWGPFFFSGFGSSYVIGMRGCRHHRPGVGLLKAPVIGLIVGQAHQDR